MAPADHTILDRLRQEIIGQGIGRDPRVAAAGLHPVYRHPQGGAIAPGQADQAVEKDDDLVVSLFHAPGVPGRRLESFFETVGVDVWIRSVRSPAAVAWEAELREAVNDRDNWMMGAGIEGGGDPGERVISSAVYRALQPLPVESGHAFVVGYLFQRYFPPTFE